ncbi:MAG: Serine phosphatase RsbU regulator of sigma subunit-like protein [Acidimicrobiales bacterium]|nr:Serine phosphatase RsbU regulator of sigma subunit-like protein [Acidimicrobiales bacterium]
MAGHGGSTEAVTSLRDPVPPAAPPVLDGPLLAGQATRVLLIEDDVGDAALVRDTLAETVGGPLVEWVRRLDEVPDALAFGPHCVLLDLAVGGAIGLEALDQVLSMAEDVPVVVLTEFHDSDVGLHAVAAGAADYLVKGDADGPALSRSVGYAIERKRAQVTQRRLLRAELLRAENVRLERGLLPRPLLRAPDLVWQSRYQAGAHASVLGGDFFDTVERPDGSVRLVVGDVCGHGPDEAALGVSLRIAWRTLVLTGMPDDEVLPALDSVLRVERQTGLFCTVCDVTISPDRRLIETRLAGHPPPVVLGADPLLLPGAHRGVPLGVSTDQGWATGAFEPASRWGLLGYTDGVIEAQIGPGVRLGIEGLLAIVTEQPEPRDERELGALLDAVRAPHTDAAHDDDLAVVALLCTADPTVNSEPTAPA